jgi:hypothetical protein
MPFAVPPMDTNRKPIYGGNLSVVRDHPMNKGLFAWCPLNEGCGQPTEVMGGYKLAMSGADWFTAASIPGVSGSNPQVGVRCDATKDNAQYKPGAVTLGHPLFAVNWPLTITARLTFIGTPTANAQIGGMIYDTGGGSPYMTWTLWIQANGYFSLGWCTNTTFRQLDTAITPVVGTPYCVIGVIDIGNINSIMVNRVVTNGTVNTAAAPIYGSASALFVGDPYTNVSRNTNAVIHDLKAWGKALTVTEQLEETLRPYGTPDNPRLI